MMYEFSTKELEKLRDSFSLPVFVMNKETQALIRKLDNYISQAHTLARARLRQRGTLNE